tara:strand:- start:1043 stop:1282 length:240 start_codon:yes stop_codon:yes gene_type:complete
MLLMKTKNILADVKSKSIKEAKEEINDILQKLEKNNADLANSVEDYKRLIQLNNHVDFLFKKRVKEVSQIDKKISNDKK